ncbi:MAG TPA: Npun_F0813 family protein [Allocoleopsis sp.]
MFILKRQDVEISSIQHPNKDQQIPILSYQGQTFRLLSVFPGNQAEEARAFWRDLTDNKGKACVLLEEPERYSVWGKVRLDQLGVETSESGRNPHLIQASLILLQTVYFYIEDFLGSRQAGLFEKELFDVFRKGNFPSAETPGSVKNLLTAEPLNCQLPPWNDNHLVTLLQEVHRLGKSYLGNTNFAQGVNDTLADMEMPSGERNEFIQWLKQTSLGKLWSA